MRTLIIVIGIWTQFFWQSSGMAQNVRWQRQAPARLPELQLFHARTAVNLPTAETLQKNNLEFEISHRFLPPLSEGYDAFWGLDGPVNMRIGLGYGITNRLTATLARSNVDDNLDLQIKLKAIQLRNQTAPILIAFQVGGAWNTQVENRAKSDNRNVQLYGQAIFNLLVQKKLGLGLVPTYLDNSHIRCAERQYSFTLGGYIQYYVSPLWSLLAEWNPTVTGFRKGHNSFSFGLELETGGHFFKLVVTNNALLNPGQFITGADLPFESRNWRFGFNITRLLKL